jgi:hypothetical protein
VAITLTAYKGNWTTPVAAGPNSVMFRWTHDLTGVSGFDIHDSSTSPVPTATWNRLNGDTKIAGSLSEYPVQTYTSTTRYLKIVAYNASNAVIGTSPEILIPDGGIANLPTDPGGETPPEPTQWKYYDGSTAVDIVLNGYFDGSVLTPLSGFLKHIPDPVEEESPQTTNVTATAENTGIPADVSLTSSSSTWITASASNTYYTSSFVTIAGDGITLTNCKFAGEVVTRGDNVTLNRCEAGGFSFSGTLGTRGTGLKALGGIGKDNFHITSDTGQCGDMELTRLYARGPASQMIGGSGNHFDGIQIRGVDGLIVDDFVFVLEDPDVNDLHNAAIFIQEANGGSRNIVFRNGLVRSGGWQTFSLYAESVHLENITVMPKPRGVYVTEDSWPFTQTNISLSTGASMTLQQGI